MKMEGIIKYIVWDNFVTGSAHPCLINQAKWNSLPADVQLAMTELSRQMDGKLTEAAYKEEEACRDYFSKAGVQIYSFSPEEWSTIEKLGEPLPGDWAKEMDAKGVPASQAMEIVIQDLKALGVK